MKTFLLVVCYLAAAHGWTCDLAPRLYDVVQVDAGHGMVVARDVQGVPHFLSGSSWYQLGSLKLKHVAIGPSGLWGIDTNNQVVKYIAGDFQPIRGLSLQHVDAGGDGQVLGIESNFDKLYCLPREAALASNGVGALNWTQLPDYFKQCSCSPKSGCWGVDKYAIVKYSKGINSSTCASNSWTGVSPAMNMKMVKTGADGSVFGVVLSGYAYERTHISSASPSGRGWSPVSTCMKVTHLSYDLGQVWLATTSGLVLKCIR